MHKCVLVTACMWHSVCGVIFAYATVSTCGCRICVCVCRPYRLIQKIRWWNGWEFPLTWKVWLTPLDITLCNDCDTHDSFPHVNPHQVADACWLIHPDGLHPDQVSGELPAKQCMVPGRVDICVWCHKNFIYFRLLCLLQIQDPFFLESNPHLSTTW